MVISSLCPQDNRRKLSADPNGDPVRVSKLLERVLHIAEIKSDRDLIAAAYLDLRAVTFRLCVHAENAAAHPNTKPLSFRRELLQIGEFLQKLFGAHIELLDHFLWDSILKMVDPLWRNG